MGSRSDALSPRKEEILRAVVECYIAGASPVGSGTVCDSQDFGVSPATVRKEMLSLEQSGYLHQPHTSSGRMPTEAGYRYFVDALMEPYSLGPVEDRQIREFFERAHGELGSVLMSLSSLLSDVTRCAAVVVGPRADSAVVRSVQLVPISGHVLLVVAVLSTGAVEQRALELDSAPHRDDVDYAADVLARSLVGGPIYADVPLEGLAAPVARLVASAADALRDGAGGLAEHLFVGGHATVVRSFGEVQVAQRILGLLERHYAVVSLLADIVDRGMRVAIGGETGLVPLSECSVVVSPYLVEGRRAGTVAVLGPTHLNYPQAMATVAVTSRQLGRMLSGG
ncbi:MAG: heat-inducible transcriptional repressor HrcA [bacterium]|nr:heat-inducible transcriptional repressor HrcA [bacterium]MCY3926477.1 heat-inducible transcriptional repressor HrcA [bacterium]